MCLTTPTPITSRREGTPSQSLWRTARYRGREGKGGGVKGGSRGPGRKERRYSYWLWIFKGQYCHNKLSVMCM